MHAAQHGIAKITMVHAYASSKCTLPTRSNRCCMQDIASIREELDNFKEFDMPVHVDSQSNTLIYRYNYEKRMSYERQACRL